MSFSTNSASIGPGFGRAPSAPWQHGGVNGEPDDYAEQVLDLIAQIPPGRVSTYGAVAAWAREITGKGGPRSIGMVLSRFGSGVPWWRVCAAGGRLAVHKADEQKALLREEDVPFTASGRVRISEVGWPQEAEPPGRTPND